MPNRAKCIWQRASRDIELGPLQKSHSGRKYLLAHGREELDPHDRAHQTRHLLDDLSA